MSPEEASYIGDIRSGRFRHEDRDKLLTCPTAAVCYASNMLRRRWPEAEIAIAFAGSTSTTPNRVTSQ
jgi:hypothetical protein